MRTQYLSFDKFKKSSPDSIENVMIVLSLDEAKRERWQASLPSWLRRRVEKAVSRYKGEIEAGAVIRVQAFEKDEYDVWLRILPKDSETFFMLEAARDSLKEAVSVSMKRLTLVCVEDEFADRVADAYGSALAARTFLMPMYGKCKASQKPFRLSDVSIVATAKRTSDAFERGYVLGEGTNLARYLATLPPNFLNPKTYGERIRKLAREHGLKVKFYSNRELKRMGAGAFTAVDQANPDSVGGIYEISYLPSRVGRDVKSIALVGKGMCFDTGGYDVKISGGMLTMKGDMQGSAVALAGVVTAAKLKFARPVRAFLAVTENHLSPKGYKADEVVTALNGLTIEVVNTDAEGRMVLADALTLASRNRPEVVVDFATLTGSAVRSLGTKFSAGFTNKNELHASIVSAGEESGERVWTFPLDKTYFRPLKSQVADTLQCMKGPGPDHIYAACFLSKFVEKDVPWVHIDLAASENDGGLAHVDSMFTGFGVRWLDRFLASIC